MKFVVIFIAIVIVTHDDLYVVVVVDNTDVILKCTVCTCYFGFSFFILID